MKKDELLKIYSAYLPYNAEIQIKFPFSIVEKTLHWEVKTQCDYPISYYENGERHGLMFSQCKLHLYPLEYLTKEIEHDGSRLIVADIIFPKEEFDSVYEINFEIEALKMMGAIKFIYTSFSIVQTLLKYHFNVFGLDEDQFVNKANFNN